MHKGWYVTTTGESATILDSGARLFWSKHLSSLNLFIQTRLQQHNSDMLFCVFIGIGKTHESIRAETESVTQVFGVIPSHHHFTGRLEWQKRGSGCCFRSSQHPLYFFPHSFNSLLIPSPRPELAFFRQVVFFSLSFRLVLFCCFFFSPLFLST